MSIKKVKTILLMPTWPILLIDQTSPEKNSVISFWVWKNVSNWIINISKLMQRKKYVDKIFWPLSIYVKNVNLLWPFCIRSISKNLNPLFTITTKHRNIELINTKVSLRRILQKGHGHVNMILQRSKKIQPKQY